MSAKRLPGRRCRFRSIIFVCRQSISICEGRVLQSELVLTIAGLSSPTRSDLSTGPVSTGRQGLDCQKISSIFLALVIF
jgi:hypothetical protein